MKTRLGFVSNSSSSSFIIKIIDIKDIAQLIELIKIADEHEFCNNYEEIELQAPKNYFDEVGDSYLTTDIEKYLVNNNIKYKGSYR